MGFQPVTVDTSDALPDDIMASAEAVSGPADGDTTPAPRKLTLMDLPGEIHRDIFKWVSGISCYPRSPSADSRAAG